MSNKIGYYKFQRMSKAEQKAFKANGGKVKLPIFTYLFGAIAVVVVMRSCNSTDQEVYKHPWSKAEAACWNYVRSETGSDITSVKAGSNKDWGKDGYAIRIHVEKERVDLSVMCYAKADGTIVKIDSPKITIN